MPPIKFTPVDEIPASRVSTGAPGAYLDVFDYLRANPGKAVKLEGRRWTSIPAAINKGRAKGCKPGEFRAVSRNVDAGGRGDIYVTYVGPKPNEDFHDKTVAL